ncbi:docking protein 3 [Sebastes fasciatus]|uniref:docking protein 3 n=1 Tax=Sebastes fasciatus TaxID=394691 RepID=UPI003D9F0AEF
MDVIFKEGKLYLHGVKFGKRSWRKIWMVLFKPSPTGVGRLEFSSVVDNNAATEQRKVYRQKTSERKVVRLRDCLSVISAPKESCPSGCTAFYLHTTQSTYTLASTTSEDWLSALCLLAFQKDPGESDKGAFERGNSLTMEDNDLYSSWKTELTLPPNQYQVTIQSTEASRRCKLAGEYVISSEEDAVLLLAVNTGHVFYRWPYRLLRKFGQVEGGFSIEAGRRCESGEGVFIFLSTHGPQIFQAISKQCSLERRSSFQPLSRHRRSFSDVSPIILPVHSDSDVSADKEDESDNHYATINDTPVLNVKQLSLCEPQLSFGEEDDGKRCHSLDALNLDIMGDSIYYNVRRATPPMIRGDDFKPVIDSECTYSDVKVHPKLHPLPPLPPITLPQFVPIAPPKPRYQRQPPANNIQPGYNAQSQPVDDMKEMEEAINSSTNVTPSEAHGSFKQRLAEIISKDLAKFQPPLPSRAGSPTFSQ